jgi:hypothetical protein
MAEQTIITRTTREVTQRVLRATTKTDRALQHAVALNRAVQEPLKFLHEQRKAVEELSSAVVSKALDLRRN